MSDLDVTSDVRYLCGMLGTAVLADFLGVSSFIVDVWRQGIVPWPQQAEAVQRLAREHLNLLRDKGLFHATTTLSAQAFRRAEECSCKHEPRSLVLIDARQQLHSLFDAFVAYGWFLEAGTNGLTPLELLGQDRLSEFKSQLVAYINAHAQ